MSEEISDEEYAAGVTNSVNRREALIRNLIAKGDADTRPSSIPPDMRAETRAESVAQADDLAARARNTIANIDADRQDRIAHAKAEGSFDTTIYDKELAHLIAATTDYEETHLAKEHQKRRPNPDKIAALEDDRYPVEHRAHAEYDNNPFAQPRDVRKQAVTFWDKLKRRFL